MLRAAVDPSASFDSDGELVMDSELQQEGNESLTEERKKAILEDYAAVRGEVVDAREALGKIRAARGY